MVRCIPCFDIIESIEPNKVMVCSCGKTAISGGKSFIRRHYGEYEEFSVSREFTDEELHEAIVEARYAIKTALYSVGYSKGIILTAKKILNERKGVF